MKDIGTLRVKTGLAEMLKGGVIMDVTDAEQAFDFRAPFVYHALYYHLTRLGYPPVLIDEIQYFGQKELGALIMAMHKIQQRQLPLVLLGAGLPILPCMAGESKSYAERLFSFPNIGALSKENSAKALQEPAQEAGGH